MRRIDDAVRRILRIKFRAGLFEHPYVDVAAAPGQAAAAAEPRGGAQGRRPLDGAAEERRPRAAARPDQVDRDHRPARATAGTTCSARGGAAATTTTPSRCSRACRPRTRTRRSRPAARSATTSSTTRTTSARPTPASPAAVAAAQAADQVVLALGETREMSGEAESRSMLDLPGQQEELIEAIKATGKPFAVVLFNGRPLDARGGRRRLAGDPRGLVRRRRGRQRRRRRASSARSTRAASCR